MHEHRTQRRMEFSDTDLAGLVHFSRFFVFMETAEDDFLRALGANFCTEHDGRRGGWPKVAASCDYHGPVRYGDVLEIRLRVTGKSTRTVSYEFTFHVDDREVAVGRTTSVCCAEKPEGGLESIPIPDPLARNIEEAPM